MPFKVGPSPSRAREHFCNICVNTKQVEGMKEEWHTHKKTKEPEFPLYVILLLASSGFPFLHGRQYMEGGVPEWEETPHPSQIRQKRPYKIFQIRPFSNPVGGVNPNKRLVRL